MSAEVSPTAVVVVSYGTSALLQTNLARVASESPDLMVVVVDNFTSTAEQTKVRELCERQGWRLVASPSNVGFGAGMNLGADAAFEAGAGRLLMLNPDAWIDRKSLQRLVDVVEKNPMTMVAPVITTTAGALWSDGHDLYLDRGRMRATRKRVGEPRVRFWLSGACLLMSRTLWDLIDGFDVRYFLYWEDVDLSWRVVEAGGDLVVVRDAVAVHDEGGTQERHSDRALSNVYYFYNVRNRLVFAAHHLATGDQLRWVGTALPEAWDILLRGGRRQLVHSAAPWWAAASGTVAGLQQLVSSRRAAARDRRSGRGQQP